MVDTGYSARPTVSRGLTSSFRSALTSAPGAQGPRGPQRFLHPGTQSRARQTAGAQQVLAGVGHGPGMAPRACQIPLGSF